MNLFFIFFLKIDNFYKYIQILRYTNKYVNNKCEILDISKKRTLSLYSFSNTKVPSNL